MTEKNYVFFILDSVGWEQWKESYTPLIDDLSDEEIMVYTSATWTLPSMFAIMYGILPSARDKTLWNKWNPWFVPLNKKPEFKTHTFLGYSGNPMFRREMFPNVFDRFFLETDFKIKDSGNRLVSEFEEDVEKGLEPFFSIFLLVDTHHPYFGIDGKEESQRKAITYSDKLFKRVYDKSPENTEFLIFSDHSEAWSVGRKHDPRVRKDRGAVLGYPELLKSFMVKVTK